MWNGIKPKLDKWKGQLIKLTTPICLGLLKKRLPLMIASWLLTSFDVLSFTGLKMFCPQELEWLCPDVYLEVGLCLGMYGYG